MGTGAAEMADDGARLMPLTPEGAWDRMRRAHAEGRDTWALDVNDGWVITLPAEEPARLSGLCWGAHVYDPVENLLYGCASPEEFTRGGKTWDAGAPGAVWDALGRGSWLVEPSERELGVLVGLLEERDEQRSASGLGDLEAACAVPAEGEAKLAVPTAYGTLVAYVLGYVGEYDGFGIDLVSGGMVRQVAEVSMIEPGVAPQEGKAGLSVSSWTSGRDGKPTACDGVDPLPRRRDAGEGPWHRILPPDRPGADANGFLKSLSLALASNDPEHYGTLASDYLWLNASHDGSVEYVVQGEHAIRTQTSSLAAMGRDALELVSGSSERIVPATVAWDEVSEVLRRERMRGPGGR